MVKVVIGAQLPAEVRASWPKAWEIVEQRLTTPELEEQCRDADAVVCLLSHRIDSAFLDACQRLRVVANYAVGYNNIDLDAASTRDVKVCNTPDVLTDATADLAWTLLLSAARRVTEGQNLMRSGSWAGWQPDQLLGQRVTGANLGVIGWGRIGKAMAKRAEGFGMQVAYCSPRHDPSTDARQMPLRKLLEWADFVSIHCPLTEATKGMIDASALAVMKSTAVLINTSRGPVIDETALIDAIESRRIFAAGMDVYEHEPKVPTVLLNSPHVVLLPHLGSATFNARREMARLCGEAVRVGINGKVPDNCVNAEVFQ